MQERIYAYIRHLIHNRKEKGILGTIAPICERNLLQIPQTKPYIHPILCQEPTTISNQHTALVPYPHTISLLNRHGVFVEFHKRRVGLLDQYGCKMGVYLQTRIQRPDNININQITIIMKSSDISKDLFDKATLPFNPNNTYYIDTINIDPINVANNVYVNAIRRSNINNIEFHIQNIQKTKITKQQDNDNTIQLVLKSTPEEEMWLNISLLDPYIVNNTYKQFLDNFQNIQSVTLLETTYTSRDKSNMAVHHKWMIFQNKQQACKTIIKLRTNFNDVKTKMTTVNKTNSSINTEIERELQLALQPMT